MGRTRSKRGGSMSCMLKRGTVPFAFLALNTIFGNKTKKKTKRGTKKGMVRKTARRAYMK